MTTGDSEKSLTPPVIHAAIGLMAFSVAAPFIGEFVTEASRHGHEPRLDVFVGWMLAAVLAGVSGVICAFVGARRAPRSGVTNLAVFMAVLLIVAVIILVVGMFR